jgi:hypothetical protein
MRKPAVGKMTESDVEASARSKLARALYRRSAGQFRASLKAMSLDDMMAAVEARTPAETIVRVLSAAPHAGLATESAWTRALARGAERKQEILARAGGCLSVAEVAQRLAITPQAVKQRIGRRVLLAVRLAGNQWGIPARQLAADGSVRAGIAQVLKAAAGVDPWIVLSILTEPADGSGGGLLIDRLSDAAVRAGVVARLRTYGEQAAS